jgi:hypothetical protein
MIRILLIVFVTTARSQIAPLIYAAPSAVSHQSRVEVKHTPSFISAPLIYSPAAIITSLPAEVKKETIITPIFATDTVLAPIALSFFNNLPLARALKHPISIDEAQENYERNIKSQREDNEEITTDGITIEKESENVVTDNKEINVAINSEHVTNEPIGTLVQE